MYMYAASYLCMYYYNICLLVHMNRYSWCVCVKKKWREVGVLTKEFRRLESKTGFISFDHSWCMYELFFSCWKWEKVEGGGGCDKRAS